jgi:hypothetical protein
MKLFGRKKTPVDLLVNQLSEEEKAFLLSHKELDRGVDDSLFTDEEKKMLDLNLSEQAGNIFVDLSPALLAAQALSHLLLRKQELAAFGTSHTTLGLRISTIPRARRW